MITQDKQINQSELSLYIGLIQDNIGINNNYKLIKEILYDKFNVTVTLEQLEKHFEPNASELELDMKLQYKHLGLC